MSPAEAPVTAAGAAGPAGPVAPVAVVTGANRGIGRAITVAFAVAEIGRAHV